MNVILSFAPLIVFPTVQGFWGLRAGLWAAWLTCAIVLALDWRASHGSVKILNTGTFVLFLILALASLLLNPFPNELWIRLLVNAGLLAIVMYTIASRRPFTLAYAREQVPPALWNTPGFIATNYRITWVWAAAFAVGAGVDLIRIFVPAIPAAVDSTFSIGALVVAGWFTSWYPKRVRAAYAQRVPAKPGA